MIKNENDMFVLERVFDAPREMVWRAWTDPKYISLWWGPKDFTCPFCEIDFRIGGNFKYCMQSTNGKQYWNNGFFQEITKHSRIVLTMYLCDESGKRIDGAKFGLGADFPSEMHDVVVFEDSGDQRTKLTLKRNVPVNIAQKYKMDNGWSQSLERLAKAIRDLK